MAEEIVRIIRVDTKNSGRSIKDLRNEIKSLKSELDKAVVGSEEFESTLRKLTQTQKSYNEVQQQIKDLSRTNQQDMLNFAKFASNLGKSYSALNAAVGLFADKNEDVQKAMLKVQRTIQLIQGLDGITGLIRDIPKVVAGFKSWVQALNPLERQIDRIAKGINGIDPAKARAMNEAGRAGQGGTNVTATAGGSVRDNIEAENRELEKQTKQYYPALINQRKQLSKEWKDVGAQLEKQTQFLQDLDKVQKDLLNTYPTYITQLKEQNPEQYLELVTKELTKMGYSAEEANATLLALAKGGYQQTIEQTKAAREAFERVNAEIKLQEASMGKLEKAFMKMGKTGAIAFDMLKTALYSIGIGILITAIVKAIDYIGKLIEKAGE